MIVRTIKPLTVDDVAQALGGFRLRFGTEQLLQADVAEALTRSGMAFRAEVPLSDRDRIDFVVEGGIGIECKVAGSMPAVASQLLRYSESDLITGLVLVSRRHSHRSYAPSQWKGVGGKPYRFLWTGKGGL